MAVIKHTLNQQELAVLLRSSNGAVAKDLFRRGKKVEARAKKNLNENEPRRVDTGLLRSSITTELLMVGGSPAVRVGTGVVYAVFVHDGTGIYGPRGTPIVPKTARMLAWKSKKLGKMVFAKSVKGMKPNPFLKNAVMAAKD